MRQEVAAGPRREAVMEPVKNKKAVQFTKATALAMAAARVLNFLTDDHESCNICDRSREEGHDVEYPCGELEAMIPKKILEVS